MCLNTTSDCNMSHNIIVIAPIPSLPTNDGYSYYFMKRIEYFKKKKYKIYFFASTSTMNKEFDFFELEKYCEKLQVYKYVTLKNSLKHGKIIRVLAIIGKFWLPLKVSMKSSKKMKNDILSCLNTHKIDAIFIEYPYLLVNVPIKIDVPIILAQHNLEFNKIKKMSAYYNFFKKMMMLHESFRLKKYEYKNIKNNLVSLYTFISKENKKEFENLYGVNNTYLLPVGYDICTRCQSTYQKGKIVFVGAMNSFQNIVAIEWFAHKIFPAIMSSFVNAKLYIIGKNPDKKILSLRSENIVVTGTVDQINEYINDAHLYIIPLVFGDGVKIKTLEAFATGNIVISTSIGVEGIDFIPDHDYILANTEGEFIESCKLVLNCRENYANLAINAINKMKKLYSWDSILELYEEKIIKMSNGSESVIYTEKICLPSATDIS